MVIHPTLYPTQSPHKAYTHTHTHTHKSKLPGALTPLRKTKGSCVRERERDREREFVCVCGMSTHIQSVSGPCVSVWRCVVVCGGGVVVCGGGVVVCGGVWRWFSGVWRRVEVVWGGVEACGVGAVVCEGGGWCSFVGGGGVWWCVEVL